MVCKSWYYIDIEYIAKCPVSKIYKKSFLFYLFFNRPWKVECVMRIILALQSLQQWILRTIVKILPCAQQDNQLLFRV